MEIHSFAGITLGCIFQKKENPCVSLISFSPKIEAILKGILKRHEALLGERGAWGQISVHIPQYSSSYYLYKDFFFQFLHSPIVLFVVLVLRRMFYIKERKLSRLFGCYLWNKIRAITCEKKNMKNVFKRFKINNQIIYLSSVFASVLSPMFFSLKSLLLHSEIDVKISSTYLNTCTYIWQLGRESIKAEPARRVFQALGQAPALPDTHREQGEVPCWAGTYSPQLMGTHSLLCLPCNPSFFSSEQCFLSIYILLVACGNAAHQGVCYHAFWHSVL